jgi:hypothetical protein
MTEADDASLIASLAARGCDLAKRREVGLHFNAPSEKVAQAIADELRADGWDSEIIAFGDEWLVAGFGKRLVVSEASIAYVRRWSDELANRLGATYHGWQASLDHGMDVQ